MLLNVILDDQQTISDSLNTTVNTNFKYPRIYYWVFIDFIKTSLTWSVFELEICFFLNRSEFRQNLIGTIIRVLVRNLRAQSEIGNHERDQRVSVQSEPSVGVFVIV